VSSGEWLAIAMLPSLCLILLSGYPVAFVLGGLAIAFAVLGTAMAAFDPAVLGGLGLRLFGLMTNPTLAAVPLFIFMGMMLERSGLARDLLLTMARLAGPRPGGLGLAVIATGGLMAATTGVAGATIVTIGLIALPVMVEAGYDRRLAAGTVAAAGTLGQLIPPSIALLILADVISAAHQETQIRRGVFAPEPVSVVDLFAGAMLPGLLLLALYVIWLLLRARLVPASMPPVAQSAGAFGPAWRAVLPALLLIVLVLGVILAGMASPAEAAAIGAAGSVVLAVRHDAGRWATLLEAGRATALMSAMIFTIIIGASIFSLVFRELGGGGLIEALLADLPGAQTGALLLAMAVIFLLGFFLELVELVVVVVPMISPPLLLLGVDPVWLAVLIAMNLQTSFMTPPMGIALLYVRGVAPAAISTFEIYRGAVPFVLLQLLALLGVLTIPELATWLPGVLRP